VKLLLESQGADSVIILQLAEQQMDISHFIIASGRSTRHLRKMAESIIVAVSFHFECMHVCAYYFNKIGSSLLRRGVK
jgi:ribosomal silencing factor RsfS